MIKAPRLYQFSLVFSLFFTALVAKAQNFPPITPQNMDAVVAEIYAQFGPQIQIQPDEMTAFLRHIQPNYAEGIETPYPNIINSTPASLTFAWNGPDNQMTVVGVLNTADNQQMTDLTEAHTYTFNNLNNNDLYLFAFANTQAARQGEIRVRIGPVGFIIIVDEKIMYTNECSSLQPVGSGNNQVNVQLTPNDGAFFQISVKGCANALAGSDVCYLWMENNGAAINGVLVPVLTANNDNYIVPVSNNIASQTPGAATLSFRSLYNNSTQQYDQFSVSNAIPSSPCAQITVSRCTGSPRPIHPTVERAMENEALPFGVFPNPVQDVAQIALSGKSFYKANIVVVDCLGAIVQTRYNILAESAVQTIEMTDLAAGIYYLHVILEKEVFTFKVLKTAP